MILEGAEAPSLSWGPRPQAPGMWGCPPHALGYFLLVQKVPKNTRKGLAPLTYP